MVSCIPSILQMDSLRTQEVRTPVLGSISAQANCLPPGLAPLPSAGIHRCSGHQSLQVPPCLAARMPGSVWPSGPEANLPEILQAGGPLELGKSACFSLLPREVGVVGPHLGPNRNQVLLVSLWAPEGEFLPRELPSASLGAQETDLRERDMSTLTYFPTISPTPDFSYVAGWCLQGRCPLNVKFKL